MTSIHKTVLLNETIEGLTLHPGAVVVDATFGGGGHSAEICKRCKGVKIIALDQDKSTWKKAGSKFKNSNCNITFVNENFGSLDKVLEKEGISPKSDLGANGKKLEFPSPTWGKGVDGIVFDLGLSSDQLENSGRGFSFIKDEPLLMTMKENPSSEDLTACDVVNSWGEESIAQIIYGYGEERYSRRIAKAIVDSRQKIEIKTTRDLVKIIEGAVPAVYRRGRIHFATRTFQALRIAVNDELRILQTGLGAGFNALNKRGRMSVISFHSLEDRIVKKFFKEKEREGRAKLINKKPVVASAEELKGNPRARSAKLRILEKIK